MWAFLPQSRRHEYRHRGVEYDTFSMMYSTCLLLLNLRRKALKPNTSVKSMNHPLFISFNWKKRGAKRKRFPTDGMCGPYFITTRWKKKNPHNTKVSLFYPPSSRSLWLWENRIGGETWYGTGRNQSGTPYTAAKSHGSRKCPAPLPTLSGVHSLFHSLPYRLPLHQIITPCLHDRSQLTKFNVKSANTVLCLWHSCSFIRKKSWYKIQLIKLLYSLYSYL